MSAGPSLSKDAFTVVVVAPVYRDWNCAALLCRDLDIHCARVPDLKLHVLLVDDGSPEGTLGWESFDPGRLLSIKVLVLRRNLGHQRAISTALCHVHTEVDCDAVLVMDADGEDRPEDAIRLIELARHDPSRIRFAERRRRLENRIFRSGYMLYRWSHYLLTGVPVRVGNFSIIPRQSLGRLVCMSELWNHYVGCIFRSKLPFDLLPTNRGMRYSGQSQMNLISLVNHGLAGIATFQDVVATRFLLANIFLVCLVLFALAAVTLVRFMTDLAVPGWATYSAGLLILLLAQLAAISFSLVFMLITSRNNLLFIPIRDYKIFVDRVDSIWCAA